jgi:carbonic anhydrase/acetyltransferase-like protein (isoleucine patch superfamily)
VVRGDRDTITIGEKTNIQDNCTVHTDPGKPFLSAAVFRSATGPSFTAVRSKMTA